MNTNNSIFGGGQGLENDTAADTISAGDHSNIELHDNEAPEIEPSFTSKGELISLGRQVNFDQGFFTIIRTVEAIKEKFPSEKLILIGIAGPSGAGKSLLSKRVSSLLDAQIISLEHFVRHEKVVDGVKDDPNVFDIRSLKKVIQALKTTGSARLQLSSKKTVKFVVPSSGVIIIEGLYALRSSIRSLLHIPVAINGGVHLDLIKRILRDVRQVARADDAVLQITDVVFPLYKAFIEPDLEHAKISILNTHNPVMTMADPLYVCKSSLSKILKYAGGRPSKILQGKAIAEKQWSDMYLYPPSSSGTGTFSNPTKPTDRRSWIRVRRTADGCFFLHFYNEMMESQLNTRPGVDFPITVRTISGLLSLGYQIGAILHRRSSLLYDKDGVMITKDIVPELDDEVFIQVKGTSRSRVIQLANSLGISNHHVPYTFLYLYFKKIRAQREAETKKQNRTLNSSKTLTTTTTTTTMTTKVSAEQQLTESKLSSVRNTNICDETDVILPTPLTPNNNTNSTTNITNTSNTSVPFTDNKTYSGSSFISPVSTFARSRL